MEPVATGLTYSDLVALPEDGLRHELIDGAHYVTPSPIRRHQRVVLRLGALLDVWCQTHGGEAYVAPMDVRFSDSTVLEPDALVLGSRQLRDQKDERFIEVSPALAAEISSPRTRSHDLLRKRRVYEREGVEEYWFVDLDAERIEQYVLAGNEAVRQYGPPSIIERGASVESVALPGLIVDVADLLDA